jgi:transposase
MVNNSSLQKWERLSQKQLDTQFINALIKGMNCSMFEAMAIKNVVYEVYHPFFDNAGTMRSGQILFDVVAIDNGPQRQLSECKMITVNLTLDAGASDLEVKKQQGVIGLRRYRLQRITNEAFQQGGLLTVEDIANRLLNCGERTVCRDIKAFKEEGIVLPLRSTIKDMGKSITHRTLIVKHWLLGLEYSEIARRTNHSIDSVANYIDKFKRVVCLAKSNHEINTIAFLIKISPELAQQYYNLYKSLKAVDYRKEELDDLIKKTLQTE